MSQFEELRYKLIVDKVAALGMEIPASGQVSKEIQNHLKLLDIQWVNQVIKDATEIRSLPMAGLKDGNITSVVAFMDACDVHIGVRTESLVWSMDQTFREELKLNNAGKPPFEKAKLMAEILEKRDELMVQYRAIGYHPLERKMDFTSNLTPEQIRTSLWSNRDLETFVDVGKDAIYYTPHVEAEVFKAIENLDGRVVIQGVSKIADAIPGHKDTNDFIEILHRTRNQNKDQGMNMR
ncbi:MAG: hypothetical protein RSD49_16330 [Hafnia sp.]